MRKVLVVLILAIALSGCTYNFSVPQVEMEIETPPVKFYPLIRDDCEHPRGCTV